MDGIKIFAIVVEVLLLAVIIGLYIYLKKYVKKNQEDLVEKHVKHIAKVVNILTAVLVFGFVLLLVFRFIL